MTTLTRNTTLLGLDLGSHTVAVRAKRDDQPLRLAQRMFPSVAGCARPGVLPGALPVALPPGSGFFGDAALDYAEHLEVSRPFLDGVVTEDDLAGSYCRFLRESLGASSTGEVRAVVGLPANTTTSHEERLRNACANGLCVVSENGQATIPLRAIKAYLKRLER